MSGYPHYLGSTMYPGNIYNTMSSQACSFTMGSSNVKTHPSAYVRGSTALFLTSIPPTREQCKERQRIRNSSRWDFLSATLTRQLASRSITPLTGDSTPIEHKQWENALTSFFELVVLENPAVQADIATHTLQGEALSWWHGHRFHTVKYTLSFSQLLEWIRIELLPESGQSSSIIGWRRLKVPE